MFNVIVGQMIQEINRIESGAKEISVSGMELEQVIGELRGLSGMESPISALKRLHGDMGDETAVLRQMWQVLEETLSDYMDCEKRACGHLEQSMVLYTERKGVQ